MEEAMRMRNKTKKTWEEGTVFIRWRQSLCSRQIYVLIIFWPSEQFSKAVLMFLGLPSRKTSSQGIQMPWAQALEEVTNQFAFSPYG